MGKQRLWRLNGFVKGCLSQGVPQPPLGDSSGFGDLLVLGVYQTLQADTLRTWCGMGSLGDWCKLSQLWVL